ncbi:DUF3597 domain-containing protein [Sphingomonas colocasiae]|uniref:DUF3597 domain-containing protein n=1 Tax=Sphingomonas colocasiae TaxID=1848973 RepID=A0ABS7PS35_9SPHN|nr:DUF3597 domain-containing protein [Sphingomonas colocasiae]MBY8823485.1 DUF3597 domain-containing protein [Sphingomonas colocasiae]
MSIFGSIMNKIFGHKPATGAPSAPATPAPEAPPSPSAPPVAPAQPTVTPAAPQVDVDAVLTEMATLRPGGNWRTSIVDLLKLLDLDSSLSARANLADELGIHAGPNGSAEQNVALHKAVMRKLAENGGVVPDDLRD